jgi:elongation factor P hydroxylase
VLEKLIQAFDDCFYVSLNTRLIRGDDEPIYKPAYSSCDFNQVIFAHGFFTSALHEVSHWCLAGEERRKRVDYGYWYNADGRTQEQQKKFESVEVKPQALEWMFSQVAGAKFRISADNLEGESTDPEPFKKAVVSQVERYCQQGLSDRAKLFHEKLIQQFNKNYILSADNFLLADL